VESELVNLDAFSSLKYVNGLYVYNNRRLENADALNGLQTALSLTIQDTPWLTRLPEFSELVMLNRLSIYGNARLQNVPTFPKLFYGNIVGDAYLNETPEALLAYRPDLIEIEGNHALTELALPTNWFTGALVKIWNNAGLRRIEFTKQRFIDSLIIADNPALEAVQLGRLNSVNSLQVTGSPLLDMSVFDSVRTFERDFGDDAETP
jgi:hypothetical protein